MKAHNTRAIALAGAREPVGQVTLADDDALVACRGINDEITEGIGIDMIAIEAVGGRRHCHRDGDETSEKRPLQPAAGR
jgi:hypothetical protein